MNAKKCTVEPGCCPKHAFWHGQEASELRTGLEKILDEWDPDNGDDCTDLELRLKRLLDRVDARDSLMYEDFLEEATGSPVDEEE